MIPRLALTRLYPFCLSAGLAGFAGCFSGADALGYPCIDDGDCGVGVQCTDDGVCGKTLCGDGTINEVLGEECDAGAANGEPSSGCRSDCTLPQCGDGSEDDGEECDDGNDVDDDACSNACLIVACGNGRVDPGEECDPTEFVDGTAAPGPFQDNKDCNMSEAAFAEGVQCTAPVCGDNHRNSPAGEACDRGEENGDYALVASTDDGCTETCDRVYFWNAGDGMEDWTIMSSGVTMDDPPLWGLIANEFVEVGEGFAWWSGSTTTGEPGISTLRSPLIDTSSAGPAEELELRFDHRHYFVALSCAPNNSGDSGVVQIAAEGSMPQQIFPEDDTIEPPMDPVPCDPISSPFAQTPGYTDQSGLDGSWEPALYRLGDFKNLEFSVVFATGHDCGGTQGMCSSDSNPQHGWYVDNILVVGRMPPPPPA